MTFRPDHCEWDPGEGRAARRDDAHYLATEAVVSVGNGAGNFHVCLACASLPRFAKFKRRPLSRPKEKP